MKDASKSKLVWLGIVTVFTGLEPMITSFFETGDYTQPAITNLVIGGLIVVLRIFFTDTAIK